MKALGQNVIIKPIAKDSTKSTLILPDSKKKYLTGIAVCDDSKVDIEAGNVVYYQPSGFIEIEVDNEKLHSVSYNSLIVAL